jgi:hypothetical protein
MVMAGAVFAAVKALTFFAVAQKKFVFGQFGIGIKG